MIKAAVFDMDGTILDTAEDLRLAMNHAMEATGHRHDFTREDAYFFFGSGIRVAIRRALAREAGAEREALLVIGTPAEAEPTPQELCEMQRIQDAYLPYYSAHCAEHTGPFAGIPETLRALRAAGIRTAVVSNKPDAATRKLAEETFPGLFDLAVGEHAGVRRKPAPDMTLTALRQLGVRPEEAVYIGDTEIDIETAANAKLRCVAVTWGFRSEAYLKKCGAETIVSAARGLLQALTGG